jgi:sigma-E factor negative regulatory protein RseC
LATEQGIVIKAGLPHRENMALVKTVQSSACSSCSARHQCSPDAQGKDREIEAINLVNAKAGDVIQISMDNSALLKATFLLYVFPIICMLVGAFAGNGMGKAWGMDPSTLSVLAGIVCFAAAIVVLRKQANVMALKSKYQPKITRIIGHGTPDPPDGCGPKASDNTQERVA